jgi:hypothetical protein
MAESSRTQIGIVCEPFGIVKELIGFSAFDVNQAHSKPRGTVIKLK